MGGAFRIYESKERSLPKKSMSLPFDQDSAKTGLGNPAVSTSTCADDDAAIVKIETIDINPLGDRLLVFWSDRIVHSVQPSQVSALLYFSQACNDAFFTLLLKYISLFSEI